MSIISKVFGGGGSKPSKPEATEHEKELAKQGVYKWNRYIDRYAPLEEAELGTLNRSTSRLRGSRSNADLMQEVSKDLHSTLGSQPISLGLANLGRMNAAMTHAMSTGAADARLGDRADRDQSQLGAIKRGLGIAGEQTQGLSALGRQQNSNMLSRFDTDFRAGIQKENATVQAISDIAESVGTAYGAQAGANKQSQRIGSMMYQDQYGGRDDFMGQLDGSLNYRRNW